MPDLPQTRHSLLVRLKDHSNDAWSEFLDIYECSIIGYAQRKGLQEADARDVAQEVLSAVEKKIATWDLDPAKGSFRGWLFRVARNIAVDKLIQQSRRPLTGGTNIGTVLDSISEYNQAESEEFWKDYRRQLMHWAASKVRPQVTESSWQAFKLTALDGLPAEKVSERLGMTRANVYAAKFRIISRIQKLVAKFDDPNSAAPIDIEGEDQ
ncbi:MAG: sigma-70 family RNA polymerase sigma factor [Planctomycetota bacterium]